MKKYFIFLIFISQTFFLLSQDLRVLFIGNSYTAVNDLPSLFQSLAATAGYEIEVSSNTPGGATFQNHCNNASATMIAQGGWDYVVLQEQSQLPSFPQAQVEAECFPFAAQLNDMIEQHNPCAETVFYMTWGRKYGDPDNGAIFPPLATYEGMDSLLYERYMQMTIDNNAIVAPVGRVWRYLRTNHPEIELYSSDNSHPSLAGSYAAACAFIVAILEINPETITNDFGLPAATAQAIRQAARIVVFDNMSDWFIGERDLEASFSYSNESGFTNSSLNTNSTTQYSWNFGNGDTYSGFEPDYQYTTNGTYHVTLTATDDCGQTSTYEQDINVTVGINEFADKTITLYPNPASDQLFFNIDPLFNGVIQIIDTKGVVVFQSQYDSENSYINCSHLSSGLYFVRFLGTAERYNGRFIKQ